MKLLFSISISFFVILTNSLCQEVLDESAHNLYLDKNFEQIVNQFGSSDTCYLNRKRVRYEGGDVIANDKNGKYYHFIENTKKELEENLNKCYCNKELGIRIRFSEGKSRKVTFLNKSYSTEKGIRIGHSKRRLISLYGDKFKTGYYIRDSYSSFAEYIHFPNEGLTFYFDYYRKKKIVEIMYEYTSRS